MFFRLLKWFVLITVILLVIGILVQVFLPKGREASPARPGVTSPSVAPVASGTLKPGDSAVLRHSDLTIGNGVHLIADPADIAAFRASQARMKDPNRKSGAGADHTVMYKAGKIRLYGDGYLVRVLNVRPDGVEVEITDGEDKGKRGWAIPEEVVKGTVDAIAAMPPDEPGADEPEAGPKAETLAERAKRERTRGIEIRKEYKASLKRGQGR